MLLQWPCRTDEGFRQDAHQVALYQNIEKNRQKGQKRAKGIGQPPSYCGINRESVIARYLPSQIYDMTCQNCIELFHAVFENTTVKLLSLFKAKPRRKKSQGHEDSSWALSTGEREAICNRRMSFQLPHDFGKTPRDFLEYKLKGEEMKNLLLYMLEFCVDGIVKDFVRELCYHFW